MRRSLILLVLLMSTLACRADESSCKQVAEHLAKLAEAEGKQTAGLAIAIERDCLEHRPTRKLVQCMLDAGSLADVDDC